MSDVKHIYWDNCATTPVSPQVIKVMQNSLETQYANPSSQHRWGGQARDQIEEARYALAQLLHVQARELYFTSGATEANQMAILSTPKRMGKPCHLITQETEHSAVLGPLKTLVEQGFELTILPVDQHGLIKPEQVLNALRPNTVLVSIMHVNNELGTVQQINEIGDIIADRAPTQCLFHVDAAQSVGKMPLNLKESHIDLLSLSAHKFYGPKGIGALYVRRKSSRRGLLQLPPIAFGGGQERGLRPGTLATHQIIGLGVAAKEAKQALEDGEQQQVSALVQLLYKGLKEVDPQIKRNGTAEAHHVLNVTLSPPIWKKINQVWSHIAYSRGSACHSSNGQPSPTLKALGLTGEEASRSCRFGLGRFNHQEEIIESLKLLKD